MQRYMDLQGKVTAPKTILVVDDDHSYRELVTFVLGQEGYTTLAVNDATAAMHALAEHAPDLLITDIRLDGYNGLQLVAMSPTPIPSIVLTGFDDPAIEADARRLGAEYVVKPISPATLCAIVARKLAMAAEHGTFINARRWVRTPLTTPVSVRIEGGAARLLDVSEGGGRLQVEGILGAGLPSTLLLTLTHMSSGSPVPVEVVWKRLLTDTTWVCGVSVGEEARGEWRTIFETVVGSS
jgi:CheY-like chemotaxis protein